MSHGKKYLEAAKKVDATKLYSLDEAVKLALETATTKFDSSVEVHMNLGIDTAIAEQALRSTVALPHGTGKKVRVIAFVSEDEAKMAKDAGAIEAGAETLVDKIAGGWMDFDVAVANPAMMKSMGKIARQLGQAGLMPNPKSGTVTTDIKGTIAQIMKGQVEFRNDKQGNLHNIVGKVSFEIKKLWKTLKLTLKRSWKRDQQVLKVYLFEALL